jgi:hypothetical protein
MNERIRELAHQADLVIKKNNGNDFRFGAMDPKLEKFAELIVQDCLAKLLSLKEGYDDPGTYESTEYYQRMEAKSLAMEEAIDEIKYRFEVKS